jgi:hypothetical protein
VVGLLRRLWVFEIVDLERETQAAVSLRNPSGFYVDTDNCGLFEKIHHVVWSLDWAIVGSRQEYVELMPGRLDGGPKLRSEVNST